MNETHILYQCKCNTYLNEYKTISDIFDGNYYYYYYFNVDKNEIRNVRYKNVNRRSKQVKGTRLSVQSNGNIIYACL